MNNYLTINLRLLTLLSLLGLSGCEGMKAQGVDFGKLTSAVQSLGNTGEKSADEEQLIGQNTSVYLLQQAPLLNNPAVQRYVNRVGLWVAQQSERPDLPWRFGVLDNPAVGAYAAPGGYVFITSGLLARMNNEAELAGVLGHEIAHVVQKHHLKAIQQQAQTSMLSDLAIFAAQASQANSSGGMGSQATQLSDTFSKNVSDLYSRGLTRGDEYQADAMGVVLAARAGYDPYGLANVLQTLATSRQDDAALLVFLKVHPNIGDRLDELAPVYSYVDQQKPPTQTLSTRYQQQVVKR